MSVLQTVGRVPRSRHLPTVVITRVYSVASSSRGTVRTAVNTLRRASVDEMTASYRQYYELPGSIRSSRILLGPPDPGLKVDDQIAIPKVYSGDPISPESGTIWVNSFSGLIRKATGYLVITLATYQEIYDSPVEVIGPSEGDIIGCDVLVVIGPDENSSRMGIQYRIDAVGQE